eukprot:jgi/Bigna1/66416/fgenesh1_pg.1_\
MTSRADVKEELEQWGNRIMASSPLPEHRTAPAPAPPSPVAVPDPVISSNNIVYLWGWGSVHAACGRVRSLSTPSLLDTMESGSVRRMETSSSITVALSQKGKLYHWLHPPSPPPTVAAVSGSGSDDRREVGDDTIRKRSNEPSDSPLATASSPKTKRGGDPTVSTRVDATTKIGGTDKYAGSLYDRHIARATRRRFTEFLPGKRFADVTCTRDAIYAVDTEGKCCYSLPGVGSNAESSSGAKEDECRHYFYNLTSTTAGGGIKENDSNDNEHDEKNNSNDTCTKERREAAVEGRGQDKRDAPASTNTNSSSSRRNPAGRIQLARIVATSEFTVAMTVKGELYTWGTRNRHGVLARQQPLGEGRSNGSSSSSSSSGRSLDKKDEKEGRGMEEEKEEEESRDRKQENKKDGVEKKEGISLTPEDCPSSLHKGHRFMQQQVVAEAVRIGNEVVTRVAAGFGHVAVVTDHGRVYTWGWGMRGQLGSGLCRSSPHPLRVRLPKGLLVIDAACGSNMFEEAE